MLKTKTDHAFIFAGSREYEFEGGYRTFYALQEMHKGTVYVDNDWSWFCNMFLNVNGWSKLDRDYAKKVMGVLNRMPFFRDSQHHEDVPVRDRRPIMEAVVSVLKVGDIIGYTSETWSNPEDYLDSSLFRQHEEFFCELARYRDKTRIGSRGRIESSRPIYAGSVWHPRDAEDREVPSVGNDRPFTTNVQRLMDEAPTARESSTRLAEELLEEAIRENESITPRGRIPRGGIRWTSVSDNQF